VKACRVVESRCSVAMVGCNITDARNVHTTSCNSAKKCSIPQLAPFSAPRLCECSPAAIRAPLLCGCLFEVYQNLAAEVNIVGLVPRSFATRCKVWQSQQPLSVRKGPSSRPFAVTVTKSGTLIISGAVVRQTPAPVFSAAVCQPPLRHKSGAASRPAHC
jgi:hypothetical protein